MYERGKIGQNKNYLRKRNIFRYKLAKWFMIECNIINL